MLIAFMAGAALACPVGFYAGIVAAIYLDRWVNVLYDQQPKRPPVSAQANGVKEVKDGSL